MVSNSPDRRMLIGVGLAGASLLLLVMVPYWLAARASGSEYVFGGFLINPPDGTSYLAKMYQGWSGYWRFHLPYTADLGRGAYINLYYLFLGHAARWLGTGLYPSYQAARLLGSCVLIYTSFRFFQAVLAERHMTLAAFALALLGGGMGWLALPFGGFTSDFWVAEAYPFLSAYAAPHFSLSLGLLLWLLTPRDDGAALRKKWGRSLLTVAVALLAGLLSPFCIAVAAIVLAATALLEFALDHWRFSLSETAWKLGLVLLGGGPVLLYDLWAIHSDPILAGWNAQNLTPTPPLYDLLLSFSPLLLLALPGLWFALRGKERSRLIPAVWLVSGAILLLLPSGLQRRFMFGLYVPVTALAVLTLWQVSRQEARKFTLLAAVLLLLVLPTNLLVLLAGRQAALTHNPQIYYTAGESQALDWIRDNTPRNALILAAPDTGLLIPAHTGRRVIYGHPFETVNAKQEEKAVTSFFEGSNPTLLDERNVDYVFDGPREQRLGLLTLPASWQPVYDHAGVTIYALAR